MDPIEQVIAGVLTAESSEGGSGFNYGRYLLLIEQIVMKQGNDSPLFIPEFYVEQSQNVNEIDPTTGKPALANPAGTSFGYPCKIAKKPAAANARAFVLAILKQKEQKNDPGLQQLIATKMREWCQPSQPLRGLALIATTWKHTIQSGPNVGKAFPRIKFQLVEGQTRESVMANRAKLDSVAQGRVVAQAQQTAATPPAPAPTAQVQVPAAYAAPSAPAFTPPPPAPAFTPPPPAPAFGATLVPAAQAADPFAGIF
jgi:hypothetical protein